jgi:hypothetical protein
VLDHAVKEKESEVEFPAFYITGLQAGQMQVSVNLMSFKVVMFMLFSSLLLLLHFLPPLMKRQN